MCIPCSPQGFTESQAIVRCARCCDFRLHSPSVGGGFPKQKVAVDHNQTLVNVLSAKKLVKSENAKQLID